MEIGMIVDTARFTAGLQKMAALSEKSLPESLNKKGFYIARGASRGTGKANRSKFEQQLGVAGYRVKTGKKGQVLKRKGKARWEKLYSNSLSLAALIVNARKGRSGNKGLYGIEMRRAIASLIRKRSSSVGTLKAGWKRAISILGSAIGEPSLFEDSARIIRGRGSAKIAKPGWNPSVEINYNANAFDRSHSARIDQSVMDALASAFNAETASMDVEIAKRLTENARKASV